MNEKEKLSELKKALTTLFSKFGKILNIVAMSSFSRKGQAFVVFETIEQATAALTQLQNFPFPSEEKRMRIAYAKSKSDIVSKADGTYAARRKRELPPKHTPAGSEGGAPRKRPAVMEYDGAAGAAGGVGMGGMVAGGVYAQGPPGMAGVQQGGYGAPVPGAYGAPPVAAAAAPAVEVEVPNSILFMTNLPEDTSEVMLRQLFNQFPGLKDIRTVPGRHDIAFVEYESEMQAAEARSKLQGFEILPTHKLDIKFAKK